MLGGNRYPVLIPHSWYDVVQKRAEELVQSKAHQCPFRIGYFAWLACKKRQANPYSTAAGWAYYWSLGWKTADAENETITFSTDLAAETSRSGK